MKCQYISGRDANKEETNMALTSNFVNQVATNNIYWVDSEQQARSYPVAYGASVLMLDRNQDTMYIKSVDQSGVMTGFRICDYQERIVMPQGDFVSKADYDVLLSKINEMAEQISTLETSKNNYASYKQNKQNNRRND